MMRCRLFLIWTFVMIVGAFARDNGEKEVADGLSCAPSSRTLIVAQVPITTGFYDRSVQDATKEKEDKLKEAQTYVQYRQDKYELFLEQINRTYFRRSFLKRTTLNRQIEYLRNFFEDKLERLEKKIVYFYAHSEDISDSSKERFSFEFIGRYSGQLNGNKDAQAEYAFEKYQSYLFIYHFVQQFPITKSSQSPILHQALVRAVGVRTIKVKEAIKSVPMRSGELFAALAEVDKIPIQPLEEVLDEEYSLEEFSRTHLNKWRDRMNLACKDQITSILFDNLVVGASKRSEKEGAYNDKEKEKESLFESQPTINN